MCVQLHMLSRLYMPKSKSANSTYGLRISDSAKHHKFKNNGKRWLKSQRIRNVLQQRTNWNRNTFSISLNGIPNGSLKPTNHYFGYVNFVWPHANRIDRWFTTHDTHCTHNFKSQKMKTKTNRKPILIWSASPEKSCVYKCMLLACCLSLAHSSICGRNICRTVDISCTQNYANSFWLPRRPLLSPRIRSESERQKLWKVEKEAAK